MSIKDGGPVHPLTINRRAEGGVVVECDVYTGASLRDHFAGLAMAAMLGPNHPYGGRPEEFIPAAAYRMADAMIRAREQRT